MLVDSHWTWRENQALTRRLKKSNLSAEPCVEDINYRCVFRIRLPTYPVCGTIPTLRREIASGC